MIGKLGFEDIAICLVSNTTCQARVSRDLYCVSAAIYLFWSKEITGLLVFREGSL